MTYDEIVQKVENLENDINNLKKINTENIESDELFNNKDLINSEDLRFKAITGTTSVSVGTETTHAHYLKVTPKIIIITEASNGIVYISNDADAENIYVKGSAASLNFTAYLL